MAPSLRATSPVVAAIDLRTKGLSYATIARDLRCTPKYAQLICITPVEIVSDKLRESFRLKREVVRLYELSSKTFKRIGQELGMQAQSAAKYYRESTLHAGPGPGPGARSAEPAHAFGTALPIESRSQDASAARQKPCSRCIARALMTRRSASPITWRKFWKAARRHFAAAKLTPA